MVVAIKEKINLAEFNETSVNNHKVNVCSLAK